MLTHVPASWVRVIKCVALSDEEKNENCQHLLASDEDSDGKISPLEVCQRKIVFEKHFQSNFFSDNIFSYLPQGGLVKIPRGRGSQELINYKI